MTEVIIDGIKYVPSEDRTTQVETMRKVLESIEYLSSKAIDEIVSKFEEFSVDEKPQKNCSNNSESSESYQKKYWAERKFRFDARVTSLHIKWVYPNGNIEYHSKYSPSPNWRIQDAISIVEKYHDGLTYGEFNSIVEESNVTRPTVSRILYSYLYGDLKEWIDKWKRTQSSNLHHQKKLPIQNNPEKRKEMGYYG